MTEPDRLAELRRQRALVADHLAWLDREIAAAQPPAGMPPAPEPATPTPEADFSQYRVAPADVVRDVRRGCFLYFTAALLISAAAVAAVLWLRSR